MWRCALVGSGRRLTTVEGKDADAAFATEGYEVVEVVAGGAG